MWQEHGRQGKVVGGVDMQEWVGLGDLQRGVDVEGESLCRQIQREKEWADANAERKAAAAEFAGEPYHKEVNLASHNLKAKGRDAVLLERIQVHPLLGGFWQPQMTTIVITSPDCQGSG